jgi:hypothetical protein
MGNPIVIFQSGTNNLQFNTNGSFGWFLGPTVVDTYNPFTSQFGLSANFQLRDVINPTDFTALFDRYKIAGVKLKFSYQNMTGADATNWNNASLGPTYTQVPIMDYSYDADDSEIPTSRPVVQQKGYAKQKLLTAMRPFNVFYKPRVTKSIYATNPAFSSEKACYLDCNSSDIEHYGFKAWISGWPFNNTIAGSAQLTQGILTIQPVFYISCKDSQ